MYARELKRQTLIVYFAARDPDMPAPVRFLAFMVAAYVLSPIDRIPDFIPVLGYLDELIIIPLGLALILRFTPVKVIEFAQLKAAQTVEKSVSNAAAAFCVLVWLAAAYFCATWVYVSYNN